MLDRFVMLSRPNYSYFRTHRFCAFLLLLYIDISLCPWAAESLVGTKIWICKPTGLNQGRGIFLLKSQEDVAAFRLKLQDTASRRTLHCQPQPYIVQQYVDAHASYSNSSHVRFIVTVKFYISSEV